MGSQAPETAAGPSETRQRAPPPGQHPGRDFLGGDRVADVVAPGAVDVQLADPDALVPEAELFHHPARGGVLRPDRRLEPVHAHHPEAVVDGHRQRRGDDPAPGVRLVDPVADLPGPRRAPDDGADGQLPGELAAVADDPGQRDALPGLAPHGAHHRHVRPDRRPDQRRLGVRRLPRPQPGGVPTRISRQVRASETRTGRSMTGASSRSGSVRVAGHPWMRPTAVNHSPEV